jgi:hypothetical protein
MTRIARSTATAGKMGGTDDRTDSLRAGLGSGQMDVPVMVCPTYNGWDTTPEDESEGLADWGSCSALLQRARSRIQFSQLRIERGTTKWRKFLCTSLR